MKGLSLAGKYELESQIRKSETGDLYRGRHRSMERAVIVKTVSPAMSRNTKLAGALSAEARTISQIFHPNILDITDYGTDADGTHYVIYEGADGETLAETIRRESPISVERSVNIAEQLSRALSAAHGNQIFHGNLTPENVLIGSDDSVKVFNFGADGSSSAYAAPEAVEPDARSDIYSLGVVLYEMLAGQTPFAASVSTELPPPLRSFREDVPGEVEGVVLHALARDPDLRYQTAVAFAEDLDQALSASQTAVPVAATPANNIWKTAFIVLAGISILAGALIYATSVKQTDPITRLQPDANGQPVQPINPATGQQEQAMLTLTDSSLEIISNSNMAMPPVTTLPGDGYNAWGSGTAPPVGAPIGPAGPVITIDPATGSPFMPPDGVILVPVPTNANTTVKPSPTPKQTNTNAVTPQPKPSPAAPKPEAPPANKPANKAEPPA